MLIDVIKGYVNKGVEHLHTAIPGKVIRYDASQQRADIQPLVKERYLDEKVVDYPPILDVPVIFPSAGGGIITFPVEIGDTMLVIFCERSIDKWVRSNTNNTIDPKDTRKHDLSDAVAIPGLYSFQKAKGSDTNDVVIKYSGSSIKLKKSGDIELIPQGLVKISGDLLVDGDITTTGDVTADGLTDISLRTHVHGGVETGGGTSGPAAPPP
jgi:hypothetical protein